MMVNPNGKHYAIVQVVPLIRLKSSRNTENLKLWADKWKESYSQSVDQGVCPSKSWNG